MRSVRETYDLPKQPPAAIRMLVFMAVFAIGAIVAWLAFPDSAISVAVLFVALLLIVGGSVWWLFTRRDMRAVPGREPMQPPSTEGRTNRPH